MYRKLITKLSAKGEGEAPMQLRREKGEERDREMIGRVQKMKGQAGRESI